MSASSSKLNSLTDTIKENIPALQNLNAMAPNEENNNKGMEDLSQGKKKAFHQCRQKTANFVGSCKKNRNNRPCTISYCDSCLLNRYGEQGKVAQMDACWICPKCRGICNCSRCRKNRGEKPTGRPIHVAKASGCSSVHDLLVQKGSEAIAAAHVDGSLKRVSMGGNNIEHEGTTLISLLPLVLTKKRRGYRANEERAPSPRAEDNLNVFPTTEVTPSGSQVTSSAGATVVEDNPIKAGPQFRLFGFLIQ